MNASPGSIHRAVREAVGASTWEETEELREKYIRSHY